MPHRTTRLALTLLAALAAPAGIAFAQDKPKAEAKAKDEAPTAASLIKKALEKANASDLPGGIAELEQAVKLEPKNRQGLFLLGAMTQIESGKMDKGAPRDKLALRSAAVFHELKAAFPAANPNEKGLMGQAFYNEACIYALDKKDDKAIASLTEAVDAGFGDAKLMAADDDLASIRKRAEYTALAAKVEAAAKKVEDEQKLQMAKMAEEMLPKVKAEMKEFKGFPFAFSLPDLDGKTVTLADYKGKVTIVDIWGTWCPPCRMEIPHFVDLRAKYAAKGFDIVGINYENGDPSEAKGLIAKFAKENKISYTCVLGDEKTQAQVPDFQGFPTTLFLDRTGKVRYLHVGYAPMPVLEEIVKTLLDEPTAEKTTAR